MLICLLIWLLFSSTKLSLVVHCHVGAIWMIRMWYFWGWWGRNGGGWSSVNVNNEGLTQIFCPDKHVTRTIWSLKKIAWETIWIQIMFSRRSCLLAVCLSPPRVDKPKSRVKRLSEVDWSQCQQSWDFFQPKAMQPVWSVRQAGERNN